MDGKTFRVDWYANDSFIDFSTLEADEIGVLMQIINLIYIRNGPVDNDPKFIGKNCNVGAAKCRRIINSLINSDNVFLTEDGKIFQKRCRRELKIVQERREKYSKIGQKGAEKRWHNEQDQVDADGNGISDRVASTSTITKTNNKTPPYSPPTVYKPEGDSRGSAGFNVEHLLNDGGLADARREAPGWDLYALMGTYNERVHKGDNKPPHDANKAFPAWCALYTKGQPPS